MLDEAQRARVVCAECDEPLDREYRCGCGEAHCPYCGSSDGCVHLVAAAFDEGPVGLISPGGSASPMLDPEELDLPPYPDELDIGALTEEQRGEIFGALAPLLTAYESEYVNDSVFLSELLCLTSEPVMAMDNNTQARFPTYLYYAEDAEKVHAEATALLAAFRERLTRCVAERVANREGSVHSEEHGGTAGADRGA